jgi:hypothetical protein
VQSRDEDRVARAECIRENNRRLSYVFEQLVFERQVMLRLFYHDFTRQYVALAEERVCVLPLK